MSLLSLQVKELLERLLKRELNKDTLKAAFDI